MFSKRGSIAINWIVVAGLALITMFILMFVFQSQVSSFVGKFIGIGEDVDAARDGAICDNFFEGRKCFTGVSVCNTDDNTWSRVSPPPNGWDDCPKNTGETAVCCSRIGS
jgi:hypothetical protein